MKKLISVLLLAAMLLSVLAGCGTTLEEDEKGATVKLYMGNALTDFDPAIVYGDETAAKLLGLVYEGLTRIDADGDVENALMKDYEIFEEEDEEDPSKNEYWMEITIKDTAWNDGRKVMADDIVYAWKRILDPGFSCDAAALLFDIKNARAVKAGDESIDDLGIAAVATNILKVEFESKIDYEQFLENLACLALVPLREDVVARNAKEGIAFGQKGPSMCSNGPFAVKGLERDLLRLERNIYYYRDTIADDPLDEYVLPFRLLISYKSEDKAMTIEQFSEQLFENGDIYYLSAFSGTETAAAYEKDATVTDLLSTHSYMFNVENELFADKNVRLALSMALDREHIAKNIVYFADAATGLVPSPVYDKEIGDSFRKNGGDLIVPTGDIAGAKALLGKTTGKFVITCKEATVEEAIANYCAEVWGQLGFKVTVKPLFDSKFYDAYNTGDYDVIAFDFQSPSTDSFGVLAPFAAPFSGRAVADNNYEYVSFVRGYENAEYDQLIETAFAEKDRAARSEILHQAEKLLMEEMPIIPVIFNKDAYVTNDTISDVGSYYYGFRNFNNTAVEDWRTLDSIDESIKEAEEAAAAQ